MHHKRAQLLDIARRTLAEDMELSTDDRFDEFDQASTGSLQALEFRLRGREFYLLHKIERALAKSEDGSFGECEECEEPISLARLWARPEAELCINCKEAQEKDETQYVDS